MEKEKQAIKAPRPVKPDHSQGIARKILADLGKPSDLARIDVRPLWDECFRVNVLCTTSLGMMEITRITDSFFIMTSADGEIVGSSPTIRHRYPG